MKVARNPSKVYTCDEVCLEKDGKHSKGISSYTSFQECDGVAKPKEGKEKNGKTGDEKKVYVDNEKEDTPKQKATVEKDLEGKKDVEDKEEKEEKKKAARQRRMRRYRF